jgi:hypothetical protein
MVGGDGLFGEVLPVAGLDTRPPIQARARSRTSAPGFADYRATSAAEPRAKPGLDLGGVWVMEAVEDGQRLLPGVAGRLMVPTACWLSLSLVRVSA